MIAEELINLMLPPLKGTDTAQMAMDWMEEFHITQLPVVEERIYKGLISEAMLLDANNLDATVSSFKLEFEDIFVMSGTHFYDVVKLAMKRQSILITKKKRIIY